MGNGVIAVCWQAVRLLGSRNQLEPGLPINSDKTVPRVSRKRSLADRKSPSGDRKGPPRGDCRYDAQVCAM